MLPRLGVPSRAVIFAVKRTSPLLENSNAGFELFKHLHPASKSPILAFVRHATSRSQASVNRGKDGPGKRLGAKKTGEQYVIPGNIIFRQRGTLWFPGENCGMGRDHTIYALQAGYVKYYLDPERHSKRKYIGVVFERDQKLPLPRNSARRRRLGRVVTTISEPVQEKVEVALAVVAGKRGKKMKKFPKPELEDMRPGYMYRESNWEIGRTAEKRGVYVKPFKPRDRWAAWRKSTIRKEKNAEKRGFRRAGAK